MDSAVNKSGLRPLGSAVLIKPYQPERKKSMIVMAPSAEERQNMVEIRGIVVEVGPEAWLEEKTPRALPGDKVLIANFAGRLVKGTLDGEVYRMVNANDIYCGIREEA